MICLYYGLVAFGCIWFFRSQLFTSAFNVTFKFLFPLLGGLGLFFVLAITLRDSSSPDYGSGAEIGGVGLVLILGLGLILIGTVSCSGCARRNRPSSRAKPSSTRGRTP